jgi:hypothetical protein
VELLLHRGLELRELSRTAGLKGLLQAAKLRALLRTAATQVSAAGVARNDGTLSLETVPEVDTTTITKAMGMTDSVTEMVEVVHNTGPRVPEVSPLAGAASACGGIATAGDSDSDTLEVVMGHLGIRASGLISLSKAMGATHFALRQVQDVLHQERDDLEEERHRLMEWGSLLKK